MTAEAIGSQTVANAIWGIMGVDATGPNERIRFSVNGAAGMNVAVRAVLVSPRQLAVRRM